MVPGTIIHQHIPFPHIIDIAFNTSTYIQPTQALPRRRRKILLEQTPCRFFVVTGACLWGKYTRGLHTLTHPRPSHPYSRPYSPDTKVHSRLQRECMHTLAIISSIVKSLLRLHLHWMLPLSSRAGMHPILHQATSMPCSLIKRMGLSLCVPVWSCLATLF